MSASGSVPNNRHWAWERGGKGTSNIEHRTSNIEHRTSNIEHRTSNIERRTPNVEMKRKKWKRRSSACGEDEVESLWGN
jgi:hypothetical protein